MRKFLIAFSLLVLTTHSAAAATRAQIDALFDLLSMDAMFEVMRDEGLAYSDELADEMLPGGTGPGWQGIARRIHDPEKMRMIVKAEFLASFGDADAAPLLEFLPVRPVSGSWSWKCRPVALSWTMPSVIRP